MRFILKLILSISLFLLIASYGLPLFFDLLIVLFIIFIIRFNFFNLIFLNVLLFVVTLLMNIILIKDEENLGIFYRAHERFSIDRGIYKKNISSEMLMKHGDIVALDVCNNEKIQGEQRIQKFITDENGFRNNRAKIDDAEFILVGDSFIAGSSNTQANTPANILGELSKKDIYSITVISEPKDYEFHLMDHIDKLSPDAKILLFYFAGNDFKYEFEKLDDSIIFKGIKIPYFKYKIRSGYERLERNKDKIFINTLYSLYDKNFFYQRIRPKSQRFFKKTLSQWTKTCPVKYYKINGVKVGFYYLPIKNYSKVSTHIINDRKILNRIKKVYYIPTKYSVYNEFINNEDLKSDDFNYLKKEYQLNNIEVVNLTKILKEEAKKNLKMNKFIYWKDDSHWNKSGINAVMENIFKTDLIN